MSLTIREIPEDELTEKLRKSYSGNLGTVGYITVEGCCMPRKFAEYAQAIQDMTVRKDDIFVLSFPKCGILAFGDKTRLASNSGELTTNRRPLDSVEELPSPRFIKSHLPLQLLPKALRDEDCLTKIIYVARDPRDACISRYHFSKLTNNYIGDLPTLVEMFIAGRVNYGPFWDHVLNYWKIRNQPNVLFITYEDMQKDLKSVIRRVCQFLDKTYTDEQIDALKDHLSFEKMKKNKSVNYKSAIEEMNRKEGSLTEDGDFMRSGQSRQFLKDLSEEDIELLNEWCKNALKDSDYELPKY